MSIGCYIKQARKERGMKQKELAQKLNMPIATLANYENDRREPNIQILHKIADALNVNIGTLVGMEFELDCRTSDALNILEEMLYILDYVSDYEPSCSSETVRMNYENKHAEISRDDFRVLQDEVLEFIKFKVHTTVNKNEPTYS